MYKLNDASNESKVYINLYNINLPNEINQIRNKRNSLDSEKLSKYSLNSKQRTNNSENSYKRIQKIKNIASLKENKDSISFKGSSFPICLSFMTNTNNYINSINKKFRVRNIPNFSEYKTVSDYSSSMKNINSIFENKNTSKNITNLKLINNNKSKDIKKIMSRINFSLNKRKNFLDENFSNINSSSVNIKNYNYFIGTIDKSVNIYEKKEKIKKDKKKEKIKNLKINEIIKPKRNYRQLLNSINLKLNSPKKKLRNILTKKNNSYLNTSIDNINNNNDIINKETSINDSKKSFKLKSSSKVLIPKIEFKKDNKEKIEDNNISVKKISGKKNFEEKKNGVRGLKLITKNFGKRVTNILKKGIKKTISYGNSNEIRAKKEKLENIENKENKKEKKEILLLNINKKFSKRKSSLLERNVHKRILDLQKKTKKNKIKILNIIIEEQKNHLDAKSDKFLRKLITSNNLEEKFKPMKLIKDNKINIILDKKTSIDILISNQKEKLKYTNHNFYSKYTDLISIKKTILSNKEKLFIYKSSYKSFKINTLLNIFYYSYISTINKCYLDINIKTFMFINMDFSSINLPQIDQDSSLRQSLVLSSMNLRRKEKKEIFSTVKTKFIESNKYKLNKITQIISHNFIKKELDFYNILKSVNFLDNENNARGNKNFSTNINSPNNKENLKRKKSSRYTTKKIKFTNRNNNKLNTQQQSSLSILENRKFFSKDNTKVVKMFRNSINANLFWYKLSTKKSLKNILPKPSINLDVALQKEYQYMKKVFSLIQARKIKKDLSINKQDLLKQIKGKENIESILRLFIIEDESSFFFEYFNTVEKKIDINSKDGEGNTFLILSVKNEMNYIAKFLIEKGADVNAQNLEGNSALHYALSRKNFNMADFLKLYGAHEDLINKRGFSPWECLGKSIENLNE